MNIATIISFLETLAPTALQETYDNAGLITGDRNAACSGIIITLDATEEVIEEAVNKGYNLVIAHHPIIFKGLKRITGSNYVERTVISAIRNDIAIYAIHTNLDNVLEGVSGKMAEKLGLENVRVLQPRERSLKKLYTYVPTAHTESVRQALFSAGAGEIGNYSECSFGSEGKGTFKAGAGTNPFVGKQGERHEETEMKLEVIFPSWLERSVISALRNSHPYEEVAFEVISLDNFYIRAGSGVIGEWKEGLDATSFIDKLSKTFNVPVVRHTRPTGKPIRRVALCGGAGSFLISKALSSEADAFITGDIKYHEFFDADGRLLIADIGHYESEQYTIDLLKEKLEEKFPNFAVLKTGVNTNPVHYSCR
jgi:dinuclear metal center YbgI/SA1388 family protein